MDEPESFNPEHRQYSLRTVTEVKIDNPQYEAEAGNKYVETVHDALGGW